MYSYSWRSFIKVALCPVLQVCYIFSTGKKKENLAFVDQEAQMLVSFGYFVTFFLNTQGSIANLWEGILCNPYHFPIVIPASTIICCWFKPFLLVLWLFQTLTVLSVTNLSPSNLSTCLEIRAESRSSSCSQVHGGAQIAVIYKS